MGPISMPRRCATVGATSRLERAGTVRLRRIPGPAARKNALRSGWAGDWPCVAGGVLVGNGAAVAFPDAFPVSPGHTLIVPRRHEADFLALTEAERLAVYPALGLSVPSEDPRVGDLLLEAAPGGCLRG
jgi:hypothetical protein